MKEKYYSNQQKLLLFDDKSLGIREFYGNNKFIVKRMKEKKNFQTWKIFQ